MEDTRVIPVAMGGDADLYELQKITPWIDDIVETEKDDNPFRIAEKILMNGLKGKWGHVHVAFQSQNERVVKVRRKGEVNRKRPIQPTVRKEST